MTDNTSVTIRLIADEIEKIAPLELAAAWDNTGLSVGGDDWTVERVLVALDVTNEVIDEAIEKSAGLIITHHPLIFAPLKSVRVGSYVGGRVIRLIEKGIAAYSAHTNLDASEFGASAVLCRMLGIEDAEPIIYDGIGAMGRAGVLPEPISTDALAEKLKDILHCTSVRIGGACNDGILFEKIAVCAGGGSSTEYLKEVLKRGCLCYITGDTKFHDLQEAAAMGLTVIDATHYATEIPAVSDLKVYLESIFEGKNIKFLLSDRCGQVYK